MKNNNLLVVLPTYSGDLDAAERLLNWIRELDGRLDNPILIVVDQTVAAVDYTRLFELAKTVFSHARVLTLQVSGQGWKPNTMFLRAAEYVNQHYKAGFLWLEPDCVPLCAGWLAELETAYHASPLQYMGAIIEQTTQKDLPAKHLTGCSIYPNDAVELFDKMPDVTSGRKAWDIAGGEKVATKAQNTKLIQHFWGESQEKGPVFVAKRITEDPSNYVMLDFLDKDACLFHRTKTHGLITLLQEERKKNPPKIVTYSRDITLTPPGISVEDLQLAVKVAKELSADKVVDPAEQGLPVPQ
jgi:hypothetical protein